MRSTKANATHFLLKRNLFIGIIVFLVSFFVFPFYGMSHIPDNKASILMNVEAEHQARSLTELITTHVLFRMNLETMVVLFGGLGFLTALMLWRHLFSRRQGMLQAALPDKRETDFARRCIGYLVLCLGPILLNFVLYVLIVAVNGLISYLNWSALLSRFGLLLLINLYGFAMGALASVLTGTYWAAMMAGAVLIVGLEGLATLWYYLAGKYLHTLVEAGHSGLISNISPAYTLYKGYYAPEGFIWLPSLLAIAAAMALSFWLYRVRKTEMAERTLAFQFLHPVMGFILPLMGGSIMGLVMMMSFGNEWGLFAGFVVGVGLTYWVCRMIFNQRFCGIISQWYLPAAAALVLILGAAALHVDAFGFDHFMPAREQLTSISYRPQSYHTDEYITLTSDEALDAAYAWCTLMRDEADELENGINASAFANSTSAVVVTYAFDGRSVRRYYPNRTVRNEAQPYLKAVIESEDYRKSIVSSFSAESKTVTNMYLNASSRTLSNDVLFEKFGAYYDYSGLASPEDDEIINQWLNALKLDVQDRTFEEKADDALFHLQLYTEDAEKGKTGYMGLNIYPGDMHFLTAVFGEKAKAIVAYGTGGYAAEDDVVALKVTYALNRTDVLASGVPEREMAQSVVVADTTAQKVKWVKETQNTSAHNYYFMPNYEDKSYSRLCLFEMSDVERYQSSHHYEIPEDKSQFYALNIPMSHSKYFIGE